MEAEEPPSLNANVRWIYWNVDLAVYCCVHRDVNLIKFNINLLNNLRTRLTLHTINLLVGNVWAGLYSPQ
jgi:hypothetical protein